MRLTRACYALAAFMFPSIAVGQADSAAMVRTLWKDVTVTTAQYREAHGFFPDGRYVVLAFRRQVCSDTYENNCVEEDAVAHGRWKISGTQLCLQLSFEWECNDVVWDKDRRGFRTAGHHYRKSTRDALEAL